MKFTESERLHNCQMNIFWVALIHHHALIKQLVDMCSVVMREGHGAYLYDVDGNKFIDYLQAYGPIITGHAHLI